MNNIVLCIHKNNIDDTLKTFNSYDTNLQFTVERSHNNSISFLDMEIIIYEQRNIITNWYKKPTFSGRYLNYNSHHPLSNKIAIIYCLVDRAIKLPHNNLYEINISSIKLLLKNNDYPLNIVEYHINKRLKKIKFNNNTTQNNTQISNNVNKKKKMIVLPFIKEMECVIKNFFKKYNENVVFSTINKLNSIIILGKDKNVKYNNANVVYKINCNNCNASYVGQTSRRLNVRIKSHKKVL